MQHIFCALIVSIKVMTTHMIVKAMRLENEYAKIFRHITFLYNTTLASSNTQAGLRSAVGRAPDS